MWREELRFNVVTSATADRDCNSTKQKERRRRRLGHSYDNELAADFTTGGRDGMDVPINLVIEEHSLFDWGKKHGAEK